MSVRADTVEAPLLDDEPRRTRVVRRAQGVAMLLGMFLFVSLLFVPLLLGAIATDVIRWWRARRPAVAVRLVPLVWWVLLGELLALLGLLRIWLVSAARGPAASPYPYRHRLYCLRQRWLSRNLAGLRLLFRLRFEIDGLELAGPGPVVILSRHASTLDPLLPDSIVGRTHDLGLRFVLMRELLKLPTIDIGRRFAPTLLVSRRAAPGVRELERLRELPRDLGDDEGILIYPEGMVYTEDRLARAKRVCAKRQPQFAPLVERLRHVLPPRLGGPVTLLQSTRGADVVMFGHTGLEPLGAIWDGGMIGNTVRIKVWRYPAAEVPRDHDDLVAQWLHHRWLELDEWIDWQLATPIGPAPAAELGQLDAV